MKTLPPLSALLGLLLIITAPGLVRAADAQAQVPSPATATLVELKPDDALLAVPEGSKGSFTIAATQPRIRFAVLPGQWEGARLWSSWGEAELGSDGNYYVSIGDHDEPHGHCLVYRVNPDSGAVDLVVDVNSLLGRSESQYAPGKIHGPLVDTGDGYLYFGTYRGSVRGTTAAVGYEGDWLLRYELATGQTENLGIPLPHQSWVVTKYHAPTRRFYGLGIPGKTANPMKKVFFVYDLEAGKVTYSGGPESQVARAMILGPDGRAWYDSEGKLAMYDPKKNEVVATDIALPGQGNLRAASRVSSEGIAYCLTRDGVLFAFDTRDGSTTTMGPAFEFGPQYTAALALDPTDRYLYFVPGAHGGTHRAGTPVVQIDLRSGKRKVLAFLHDTLRRQQQYHLGGSFGIALSEDGSELLINFNGNSVEVKKPDFGLCAVMLLEIPASERPTAR